MVFHINGVKVRIQFSFFLIVSFALLFQYENIAYVLLFSALHELGHLVLLLVFRGHPKEIVIAFYGIGLKHNETLEPDQEIIFLLGGDAVNAIFCALNIHRENNLPLLLMNALPLYPLDGGRALKVFLNQILEFSVSDRVFKAITVIFMILLSLIAVYLKNLSLVLITLYLFFYSVNNTYD